MELDGRIRWLALALPVALAAAATVARPAPPGVLAAGPAAGGTCASGAGFRGYDVPSPAWYRLDPLLDGGGTLAGQQLTVGRGQARWSWALPAESFAFGPVGGRVLVGDDDGRRSRLRTFDTAGGCWTSLAASADVIRSAVLTQDGTRIYEHRVERTDRHDLGVWTRQLGVAPTVTTRVLDGIAPDADRGPTFTTTVLVADDGRVVVSSCGERVCRTRVADPASGSVASVAETGPAAGVIGDRLVALEAFDGLPCALDLVDLASGAATRLDDAGGGAVVVPGSSDTIVLAEGGGIGVVRLGGQTADAAVPGTAGFAPIPRTSTATSGVESPLGRVAVAPGGRVTDPSAIRFLDPSALQLTDEVLP